MKAYGFEVRRFTVPNPEYGLPRRRAVVQVARDVSLLSHRLPGKRMIWLLQVWAWVPAPPDALGVPVPATRELSRKEACVLLQSIRKQVSEASRS